MLLRRWQEDVKFLSRIEGNELFNLEGRRCSIFYN